MKTARTLIVAAALLGACSSNPEPTSEVEGSAVATATAEVAPTASAPPDTAPVPTATETATAAAPPPVEPAADIVVVAMKVTMDPKTIIELKADKGLYVKNKKVATFDKHVLQLAEMNDRLLVLKDGSIVTEPPSPKKMRFNDKDEVEIEGGGKITIDDKGKVTFVAPEAKDASKAPKPTITGFKPEGRRAAQLAVLVGLMSSSPSAEKSAGSVTVEPKATAAPAPKGTSAPAPKGTSAPAPKGTSAPPTK